MKVAINGFGRIGRTVFRLLAAKENVEVVGINDLTDPEALAYLLRHDTVMGNFDGKAVVENGHLVTDKGAARLTANPDPGKLPWKELGVDFVVEATGFFRKKAENMLHIEAGARKVILTVPAKDEIDATIVLGVNNEDLKASDQIVSNASCTTNCLAPMAYVLNENYGIKCGQMTTIHAYTNDQRLIDTPHSDFRRARAAAENIIPTTTGAASAVGKVIPALEGRMTGIAMRVPVPTGSVVDLVSVMAKDVDADEVNATMKAASESARMKGILAYDTDHIVSSDIVGSSYSSIFDPKWTSVIDGNLLKTVSWYDNEYGYSSRVVDLLQLLQDVD